MNSVTQDMRFRQSLLKYSQKYGVTKAAIKYKTSRQYIYRWLRRYDGALEFLRDKSRIPQHHPYGHAEEDLKLIRICVAEIWVLEYGYYEVEAKSKEEAEAKAEDKIMEGNICWGDFEITDSTAEEVRKEKVRDDGDR